MYILTDSFSDVDRCCAVFGEGSGPIHMSFLDCSGTEYKLLDCGFENSTDQHDEDWSITCNNGKECDYKLQKYVPAKSIFTVLGHKLLYSYGVISVCIFTSTHTQNVYTTTFLHLYIYK